MKVIRVFEYSQLSINGIDFTQAHFEQLVRYNEQHGNKYFSVGHKRIYFKNYVGVFQVGNLVIEILPKADKKSVTTDELKNKWHNALIYMLHLCGYIKIDSISRADLRLQSITLIDLFYKLFLDEVKTIVHQGLIRAYRHKSDNLPYLKGRLVFNKHLSENYLHKEKFYTVSQVYDHNNIYNRILRKALLVLKSSINKGNLFYSEICNLLFNFEEIDDVNVSDKLFDSLVFTRNSNKYKSAVTFARLILQNYSPDLKEGANNVIGILFDMNTLFEKVVYRILKKYEDKYTCTESSLVLYAQNSKKFWENKTIRPDILGKYKPSSNEPKRQFIIDTKWKIPQDGYPSDDDLKQMYAYNIHFGAKQSVLLYPEMEGSREVRSPYRESEAVKKEFQNHTCSTFFINLFDKDGYINKNAGEDLIKFLCKEGGMNSVKFFTTEEIKQLRQPVILPSKGPRGWSKSQIEPAEVLKAFSALRLKKGFVLRAYQFRGEGGGNAVVWAIPEESPFPSPKCSPKLKDTFLEPLRPPLALDDLMEVIEGDGSHWSYLSASIFMREINEFGALWHGCSWSTHEIIDKAPSDYFNQIQGDSEESVPYTKVEEWEWLERKPKEWQPSVFKNNDKIIVTFYSFSGLGSEAIYRHIDTFQTGKYSFKTKEVLIARGCGGYVF